jgi:hypothetical protein
MLNIPSKIRFGRGEFMRGRALFCHIEQCEESLFGFHSQMEGFIALLGITSFG